MRDEETPQNLIFNLSEGFNYRAPFFLVDESLHFKVWGGVAKTTPD